jgi:hypothetical protein
MMAERNAMCFIILMDMRRERNIYLLVNLYSLVFNLTMSNYGNVNVACAAE